MKKLIFILSFISIKAFAGAILGGSALNLTPATLPTCSTNGQLRIDASNGLWVCSGGTWTSTAGGVTSVTASSPLASSGGATPDISLSGIVALANGGAGLSGAQTTLTTAGTITALPVATNYIKLSPASATTIQGIVAQTSGTNIYILAGGAGFTLKNQDTGATAANRLSLGADLVMVTGSAVNLKYDGNASRWVFADFDYPVRKNNSPTTQNIYTTNANGGSALFGTNSVVLGNEAGNDNTCSFGSSVVMGYRAGKSCNGSLNNGVVIGAQAGASLKNSGATLLGFGAGGAMTTAINNTAVGVSSLSNVTTGGTNVGIGSGACSGVSTGDYNTCIAGSGLNFGTGSNNGAWGAATGSNTANVSNCWAIGNTARCDGSDQMILGGAFYPYNIGIGGITNPAYRVDVSGDINITGNYRVNGVVFSPTSYWNLAGNTLAGGENIGSLNYQSWALLANGLQVETILPQGLAGFQKTSPEALVHAGTLSAIIGDVSSPTTATVLRDSGGYAFGSGNRDYSLYAALNVSGTTIFSSTAATTTFVEPPTSNYDPTGGSAVDQSGSGYDTSLDSPPSYTVLALYTGGTTQSINTTGFSLGSWTVGGLADVNLSWAAPVGEQPAFYYIVKNSTDFVQISGSSPTYLDTNTGWASGSSPGLPNPSYMINVSGTGVAGATYRFLDTTANTYADAGAPNINDDNASWASGSTVTPTTADYSSIKADSPTQLNGLALGIVAKTADYLATKNDHTILCDASGGNIIISFLPVASLYNTTLGSVYVVKKIDSSANTCTLDPDSSETIDGATTKVLSTQYNSFTIQAGPTEFSIL